MSGDADADALASALFGEGPGGFVVSGPEQELRDLGEHVAVLVLGSTGGESLRVEHEGECVIDVALAELRQAHVALKALFP